MKKKLLFTAGILIGIINSLFGAGGGILTVPLLRSSGLSQKSAQASCVAVILPLSAISAAIYLYKGYFSFTQGLYFIPFGIIGALIGSAVMKKISERILHYMFSLLLIYSGLRLIFR